MQLGNVVLTVQPGMGYEGDPMRLLFEKGFAPTHAFSAFYRYLREEYKADAVLHCNGIVKVLKGQVVHGRVIRDRVGLKASLKKATVNP